MSENAVEIEGLCHFYGKGDLRRQVLADVDLEIGRGEIVILTGPSGSGKTTALTLIGALRAAQQGSLNVLGHELCGASAKSLVEVRRQIGYVFQHHNLLESLSAIQNVRLALDLQPGLSPSEKEERARAMLDAVGLGGEGASRPRRLSGGQKQRVAIARALVSRPQMVLADEPTASLDKASGRDVVALMQKLAREQQVSVVLVTHDNRILDVADRIVHLEDGRLQPFAKAVSNNTEQMMGLLAGQNRRASLLPRISEMEPTEFEEALTQVTREAEAFVSATEASTRDAFESMLERMLEGFTGKIVDLLDAERGSLLLLDRDRQELWSKVTTDEGFFEFRIPADSGIAGAVMQSGRVENVPNVERDPRFNPDVDRESGLTTRCILAVPLRDGAGNIFGVAEILNRRDGGSFDDDDVRRFEALTGSMEVILESWNRLHLQQMARAAEGDAR